MSLSIVEMQVQCKVGPVLKMQKLQVKETFNKTLEKGTYAAITRAIKLKLNPRWCKKREEKTEACGQFQMEIFLFLSLRTKKEKRKSLNFNFKNAMNGLIAKVLITKVIQCKTWKLRLLFDITGLIAQRFQNIHLANIPIIPSDENQCKASEMKFLNCMPNYLD